MEVSGSVSRQIPHFPGAGTTDFSRPSKPSLCFSGELNFPASFEFGAEASLRINTGKKGRGVDLNCGFSDNGHVECYYSGPRCDDDDKKMKKKKKKEKEIKKKLKLLRGLEGLGGAQVSKLISEGAEALLQQLEKVRAEEKEMKRKKEEEEEEEENAKQMKMKDCGSSSSSSSSSSESSGSECGEVIDMSSMRGGGGVATQKILEGSEAVIVDANKFRNCGWN